MPETHSSESLTQPRGWATIQDASAYYALSVKTLRRMISRGDIEAKRFGPRLIRVNLASIEAAAKPLQYISGDAA